MDIIVYIYITVLQYICLYSVFATFSLEFPCWNYCCYCSENHNQKFKEYWVGMFVKCFNNKPPCTRIANTRVRKLLSANLITQFSEAKFSVNYLAITNFHHLRSCLSCVKLYATCSFSNSCVIGCADNTCCHSPSHISTGY